MSNNNNIIKIGKKNSLKSKQKCLEIPLNIGFYRAIVKKDNRRISVYYVTPDNRYLKDISEVCEWLERNSDMYYTLHRKNFNFLVKKYSSHRNEYFIDYDRAPSDIKSFVIQRKRSIAPVIVNMDDVTDDNDNHNTVVNSQSLNENQSFIDRKRMKLKNVSISFDHNPIELNITPGNNSKIIDIKSISTDDYSSKSNINIKSEVTDVDTNNLNQSEINCNNRDIVGNVALENTLKPNHIVIKAGTTNNCDNGENLVGLRIKAEKTVKFSDINVIQSEENFEENKEILSSNFNDEIPKNCDESTMDGVNCLVLTSRETKMKCEQTSPEIDDHSPLFNELSQINTDFKMKVDAAPTRFYDTLEDSNDESLTLSVESACAEDAADNLPFRPNTLYEYPLINVNMNSIIEIGTHCHTSRVLDVLNGESEKKPIKFMKSYCGNHCAFDAKGLPSVAFECDICLILYHSECIGYRCMTIGTTGLIICDNCHLLQNTFNLEVPNTFCNVDKLLREELKDEPIVNPNAISIPMKLESIFKLCKANWLLQNLKFPKCKVENNKEFKDLSKVTKKETFKDIPKQCRYYIKIYINAADIIRNITEECITVKYNVNDVERMATIFADSTCKMIIHECVYEVLISKITVKSGELHIPVPTRIRKNGFAIFYTLEYGQEFDRKYVQRYDNLKSSMFTMNKGQSFVMRNEQNNPLIAQPNAKPKMIRLPPNTVSRITGSLSNNVKIITAGNLIMSPPISTIVPSFSSKNLPKNVIPIPRNLTNMLKIRKRKQDFNTQKTSHCTIQYHTLVTLPFSVLEKILTSRTLSTVDKVHCRLANRVLKSVIDAGRVWNKVVINSDFVIGLQAMFDFFSQRSVKKLTFLIDLHVSFDIDFFISFIGRLKLYPESFNLEKISIKLIGFNQLSENCKWTIQDILSCNKFLKSLSVTSEELTSLGIGKHPYLTSDCLEKLKLRNIENIAAVLQTNKECTPRLRHVHMGDCSGLFTMDMSSLMNITSLRLDFSEYVKLGDLSSFSQLTNIKHLAIARPRVNEVLKVFLGHILKIRSLSIFHLETEVIAKHQLSICTHFGSSFPLHIQVIYWKIFLNRTILVSEPDFKTKISDFMPPNVKICILDV